MLKVCLPKKKKIVYTYVICIYVFDPTGQWSVTNPTGKKVYSKLFLTQLGSESVCQKKPDVLKGWNNITKLSNSPQFNSLGVSAVKLFINLKL